MDLRPGAQEMSQYPKAYKIDNRGDYERADHLNNAGADAAFYHNYYGDDEGGQV